MTNAELRKKLIKLFDAGDEGIIVLDTPDMKVVYIDAVMSAVQEYVSASNRASRIDELEKVRDCTKGHYYELPADARLDTSEYISGRLAELKEESWLSPIK